MCQIKINRNGLSSSKLGLKEFSISGISDEKIDYSYKTSHHSNDKREFSVYL